MLLTSPQHGTDDLSCFDYFLIRFLLMVSMSQGGGADCSRMSVALVGSGPGIFRTGACHSQADVHCLGRNMRSVDKARELAMLPAAKSTCYQQPRLPAIGTIITYRIQVSGWHIQGFRGFCKKMQTTPLKSLIWKLKIDSCTHQVTLRAVPQSRLLSFGVAVLGA